MTDGFELIERVLTPDEYFPLRRSVGWSEVSEAAVAASLGRELYSIALVHDGRVVGCGRVAGDGGLYFYVQDIVVLPEFQGRGLGARIMDAVMAWLEQHAPPGAFVGLMAAKGYAGFYERYGFRARPDDAPGMFRRY